MCCISLNMHILSSLLKLKIFIIKISKDSIFIFLVLNAVFITVYHVRFGQDDISARTAPCVASHCITFTKDMITLWYFAVSPFQHITNMGNTYMDHNIYIIYIYIINYIFGSKNSFIWVKCKGTTKYISICVNIKDHKIYVYIMKHKYIFLISYSIYGPQNIWKYKETQIYIVN